MKSIAIAAAAGFSAVLLVAAEQPQTTTDAKTATPQTTTAAPAPAQQTTTDSPLVAAAKAAQARKKSGKKAITNKTLAKGADTHITTTTGGAALPPMPKGDGKTEEQMIAEANAKRKEIADAQKAKEDKAKKERQQRAAALYEGDGENPYADPAMVEHEMDDANKAAQKTDTSQSTTTQQQKPPM